MDDIEIAMAGALCAVFLVCALVVLIHHEVKKGPPKKPNIRVPRETLWERTNRYHGETK